MSKVSIEPTVRQKADILYNEMQVIREEIAATINEQYHSRTGNIRAALDGLEYQRKKFVEEAKVVLREMPLGTHIKFTTQNGKGSTNVVAYTGVLKAKDLNIGLIDVVYDNNGSTGTIALNCCLQSIEESSYI